MVGKEPTQKNSDSKSPEQVPVDEPTRPKRSQILRDEKDNPYIFEAAIDKNGKPTLVTKNLIKSYGTHFRDKDGKEYDEQGALVIPVNGERYTLETGLDTQGKPELDSTQDEAKQAPENREQFEIRTKLRKIDTYANRSVKELVTGKQALIQQTIESLRTLTPSSSRIQGLEIISRKLGRVDNHRDVTALREKLGSLSNEPTQADLDTIIKASKDALRRLTEVADDLHTSLKNADSKTEAAIKGLVNDFDGSLAALFKIQHIVVQPGEKINYDTMEPSVPKYTDDPSKHETIVSVTKEGYRFDPALSNDPDGDILQTPQVEVYTTSPSAR